jgi:hypothetical protein
MQRRGAIPGAEATKITALNRITNLGRVVSFKELLSDFTGIEAGVLQKITGRNT